MSEYGFTLEICTDEDTDSPRDWCNTGTMVCWHSRYILGDLQPREEPIKWLVGLLVQEGLLAQEELDVEPDLSMDELLELAKERFVILPLYLYEHGGITMRTESFGALWDAGQVGWIYARKGAANLEELLQVEVKTYDQYLTGDVWFFCMMDTGGEIIEALGGIYGRDALREEVTRAISDYIS